MPLLALDFVQPAPRYNMAVMVSLLSLSVLTAGILLIQQQQWADEITKKNSQATHVKKIEFTRGVNMDEALSVKHAHQVQNTLNQPWGVLFKALEQAQMDNPDVRLLSVQPKPEKRQVLISGAVPEFDELVKYTNSLREQTGIGEISLLNQHWEESADNDHSGQSEKLMFNISVIWLPS